VVGKRFGKLVVIQFVGVKNKKRYMYECKCDCGNVKVIDRDKLMSGNTVSCKCYQAQSSSERKFENEGGNRYDKLLVTPIHARNKWNETEWVCKCDCGKVTVVTGKKLRAKHTTSCGCAKKDAMQSFKNPHWRGGVSHEPYTAEWVGSLKNRIRKRDKYHCQMCGNHQVAPRLDVHHIDWDKTNCEESNLLSLCRSCHTGLRFGVDWRVDAGLGAWA
jgi:hypothetical protein